MSTLDALEADKLVKREASKKDRRIKLVSITTKGQKKLAKARTLTENQEQKALADLSESEIKQLHDLLTNSENHREVICQLPVHASKKQL